jgi:molybdopterin synthase sulfur carrier subunit
MTVRIVLPGVLRELVDGATELAVDLAADTALGEVLDQAFAPWPVLASRLRDERGDIRRHVNVFVDGEETRRAQGLRTPVGPSSTVHVVNAVSGG